MADFIPYSEKQKILTTDQWEKLRILAPDCPTAVATAGVMRAVVSRLLKIDTGKNVNIDDFEFLIYDDVFPNAGFISADKTQNGKNIILVSTSITKLCKKEDEFAGVLSHELCHFIYYKIYGTNKNTHFQERFSDLYALNVMIAGGYNPVAYSDVCEEMRKSSGGASLFDVHGSSMCRKQEVDDYLSKKHIDLGDFKSLPSSGLYNNFINITNKRQDKYKSYFEQSLENKFPKILNNPSYKPPISQIFDFVINEIKNGRLNNYSRVEDAYNYIMGCHGNGKAEIQSTQYFVEQLLGVYTQNAEFKKLFYLHWISEMFEHLKSEFRDDKPFKVFPPITDDLNQIDEFMTSRDVERVKELAIDLHNGKNHIFSIYDMKEFFGKPSGFKMPSRVVAKGHTMPTEWLYSVAATSDMRTRTAILYVLGYIGYDCDYEWLTDEELNKGYSYDDKYHGKILATNKREIEKIKKQVERQNEYEADYKNFKDFMYAMNLLYDFDSGKISAPEVVKRLERYGNQPGRRVVYSIDSMLYWLGANTIFLADYNQGNKFLKSELQELNNSQAFADIYIIPFLRNVKQVFNENAPELAKKIHLDKPPKGMTWFEYLQYVASKYLKLKEDATVWLSKSGDYQLAVKNLAHIGRKMGIQSDGSDLSRLWNVPAGPITEHVSRVRTEKLHSILVNFVKTAVEEGVYSKQDAAKIFCTELSKMRGAHWVHLADNKIVKRIDKLEVLNDIDIDKDAIEQYSVYANKEHWASDNLTLINNALYQEIEQKTDLHKIQRFLTAFGMIADTEEQLIQVLSKPTPMISDKGIYQLEESLKEFTLTYYMRKKTPIKNLYHVLSTILPDRLAKFSDRFTDELDEYIEKNHLMPTDFQSLYDMHAIMQRLNMFSKEKSTHTKVLNSLVEKIEKMPRPYREKYSWNLLSGFYYDDNDTRYIMNRKSDNIDQPLIRNKLVEMYANAIVERLWNDDNSDEYFAKIQELSNFINQPHKDGKGRDSTRNGINKLIKGDLYRLITDKIQSQERVSQFLMDDNTIALADIDIQKKDFIGRGVEALLDILEDHREMAFYSIEFLNRKLTQASINEYREKCIGTDYGSSALIKLMPQSTLENLYHTFWSAGLQGRAVIMNKLLNRAFETLDEKIKYVCNLVIGKDDKYRDAAEMIGDCLIKSFEPYEQSLILAAVASADENKQEGKNASRSVGEGLRMFFENMGPAWVKFGQLLSYVPDLPSEIRHDLGKLKDKADIPARWDVYKWLHEALPNDLYARVERVEDVVGAGSFWMTAVVQLKNEQGETEKKVIQLLRENADARADSGFKTIEKAIDKLAKRDSSYKMLHNVAHQAHESAKYEVDAEIGNKQYEKAKDLYSDIHVAIDGTEYTPNVADWRYYGDGYKIMDYAPGATLSRINASDDERRKMALAYFTIEMVNLFKGDVWDIDRHQGQQNFDIVSPTKVDINIYDTGAQLPKAPDNKNKVLLANIFFDLIQAVQSGQSIDSYLLKIIKRLDRLQNVNIDVSYVSNVQKGLMALSDIIEYQKEIKDADGNIIQERKALSADDLKNAIIAVLKNPSLDKYIELSIKGRVVINRLAHMDIKTLKEFINGSNLDEDNPVKIKIIDKSVSSKSKQILKDADEIAALNNQDNTIMGINKKYIKQHE